MDFVTMKNFYCNKVFKQCVLLKYVICWFRSKINVTIQVGILLRYNNNNNNILYFINEKNVISLKNISIGHFIKQSGKHW